MRTNDPFTRSIGAVIVPLSVAPLAWRIALTGSCTPRNPQAAVGSSS
jgi:hypothetical protein